MLPKMAGGESAADVALGGSSVHRCLLNRGVCLSLTPFKHRHSFFNPGLRSGSNEQDRNRLDRQEGFILFTGMSSLFSSADFALTGFAVWGVSRSLLDEPEGGHAQGRL